jgi:hypothetical protein
MPEALLPELGVPKVRGQAAKATHAGDSLLRLQRGHRPGLELLPTLRDPKGVMP